ncbi:MAG: hybrid sensor histidine kinase/response regulator [Okeania sp. SIO3I5]|uniref:hybrid sensor histidine kinase/response regulator n=1 Tax=Okeania sp. SIO3I5 TaxID=2607805 RepID=UPI0013B82478|nr:response regulator [Okeania sp. SIO3I5]NEQ35124.1 hybrid sensor histidine kinase/response regulator [Okeania sp. SIO3I5]
MIEIDNQAYEFFVEETTELLQTLEEGLINISQEHELQTLHKLMRAAHSIKGGAACLGFMGIKTIAHDLENGIRALYQENTVFDLELENLLLQAFDCLQSPTTKQIETGNYDENTALTKAKQVFEQLENKLGHSLEEAAEFPEVPMEQGDMAKFLFTEEIPSGLHRWENLLSGKNISETGLSLQDELHRQAEVFATLGTMLNLPGFTSIAKTTIKALEVNPKYTAKIGQLALADFWAGQKAVLEGDRAQGGKPNPTLVKLTRPLKPKKAVATTKQKQVDQATEKSDVANQNQGKKAEANNTTKTQKSKTATTSVNISEQKDSAPEVTQNSQVEKVNKSTEKSNVANQKKGQKTAANNITKTQNSQTATTSVNVSEQKDSAPEVTQNSQAEKVNQVTKKSNVANQNQGQKAQITNTTKTPTSNSEQEESVTEITHNPKQIEQKSNSSQSQSTLGIRIDLKRLEMLNNLVGELATQDNSFILQNQQTQASIETLDKGWQRFQQLIMNLQDITAFSEKLKKSSNPQNQKLASLLNIIPNLTEEISQIGEAVDDIKLLHQQTQQVVKKRQQTLQQIQSHLNKTRMLPVESLFNRFPRMIRDLSVEKQKQVKLELVGMNTMLDKAVLEKLYDPIVHILRNAFDHGIEPVEIRQVNGKSEVGIITIKSYYQGNYTYIEIQDDGGGIDVEKIRNKAIVKQLISASEATKLSTKQLYQFLFYPDFSTKEKVSDLSGRGVGLDAVLRQIEALKGNITIQSEIGKGTRFLLRLPWTLTITKLLVFRIKNNLFAIPLDILATIVYAEPSEIKSNKKGEETYTWQGKKVSIAPSIVSDYNYPIVLENIQQKALEFGKNPYGKSSQGKVMLLLISEDTDTIAIKIEQILMEQNLTIKPFSKVLTAPSYFYGCTILGDGSLVPVIDGIKLLEKTLQQGESNTHKLPGIQKKSQQSALSKLTTILVIDDSLTTRQTISQTLQKSGYNVVQAKDAKEGLVKLQRNAQIQAIICDVEMPEMNGFEFLSRCRKQYSQEEMPVLMLTSRASQPYRQLAKQLGANDYLTKPYLDQDLINSLQKYLSN